MKADRPRDLLLCERGARPLDRARDGRRRTRAHRPGTLRADAGRRHRGRGDESRLLRPGWSAAAWLSTANRCASCRPRRASSCSAERKRATRPAAASGSRCPRPPAARSRRPGAPRCGSAPTSACCLRRKASRNPWPPRSKLRSASLPHSLVDVSHRQVALAVAGPAGARPAGQRLPARPRSGRAFPVGMCTRTVLARADVVLWRSSPEEYHLETGRSFSAYVAGVVEGSGTRGLIMRCSQDDGSPGGGSRSPVRGARVRRIRGACGPGGGAAADRRRAAARGHARSRRSSSRHSGASRISRTSASR